MAEIGGGEGGFAVDEDAETAREVALHAGLLGVEEGDLSPAQFVGGAGGIRGVEIGGKGEKDGDEVGGRKCVGIKDRAEELTRGVEDGRLGVFGDGDGSADCVCGHGARFYTYAARLSRATMAAPRAGTKSGTE